MKNIRRKFLVSLMVTGFAAVLSPSSSRAADSKAPGDYPQLKRTADGYWQADFDTLASFELVPPKVPIPRPNRHESQVRAMFEPQPQRYIVTEEDDLTGRVPPAVQSLDGQKVRVTGFMLPIHLENGLVTDFLIIRSQLTCCFGVPPAPNEWVVVAMKGKGVPQQMDVPSQFYGVLHVGPMFENHEFSGLYRLECEKVVAP